MPRCLLLPLSACAVFCWLLTAPLLAQEQELEAGKTAQKADQKSDQPQPPKQQPVKETVKQDEAKKDEPKKDEAKKDEAKKDEPKKDEPKKDEPKKDEPKKDEPKKDEPKKDEPKKDEPKKDEPKKDEPKKDEPKKDEPKKDEPKKDEPKKDEPKKDEAKKDEANQEAKEDEVLAGHSYHGEAFNEGPRQRAYLMPGMPEIRFPVTTKVADAQKFVEQGVGQLHGFWYLEAERSFRQAAALDADCAMAYWGMAMANANNEKRAKAFIAEAVKRKDTTTPREKKYIEALDAYIKAGRSKRKERSTAYTNALEKLLYDYPEDLEARAFLALQLWKNRSSGAGLQSYLAVDALLEQVFDRQPMHPAHHYRIHLWDYQRAETALTSAAVCGQTAPGIAHMWHMPGHIYSKLKRYDDACFQQEASARVDHAHMMRDRVMPDQINNFAHNNEWLIRNLNYVGRVQDAIDLAKNMTELPRHPKYNTVAKRGSSNYGRTRLFETLVRFEKWDQLIELCHSPYLEPTDVLKEQAKRWRHLGAAQFRKGDLEGGRKVLAEVQRLLDEHRSQADLAATKAEEKVREKARDQKAIDVAVAAAIKKAEDEGGEEVDLEQVKKETSERVAAEQIKAKQGDIKKAGTEARKPFASKLREWERAAWELEGHQAIANGDVKKGYPLLKKAGGVSATYLNEVRFLIGETDQAISAAQKYADSHRNEVEPRARLVELQWRADKQDDARKSMEKLREISASIDDLQCPVFARLAPVAAAMDLPEDWRLERKVADDVGDRPDLDTLGPFRWSPSPAPEWTLRDSDNNIVSMKQFQGRPVVVIFYLGYGCLHCVEQLHKFAPAMERFEKQGIALVAISSDNQVGLKTALDNYEGGLPIPLVSNEKLDVFKAFRAYDDFEQQPLHGTYLIDAEGRIRWQDISYEPFMDVEFLLGESKRLLDQSK